MEHITPSNIHCYDVDGSIEFAYEVQCLMEKYMIPDIDALELIVKSFFARGVNTRLANEWRERCKL